MSYLIVGPKYDGEIPSNFDADHVIRSNSRFTFVLGRTAVYGDSDIPCVEAIQKKYVLLPLLKEEEKTDCIPVFPFIDTDELAKEVPEPQVFFTLGNFILNYVSVYDDETDLIKKFGEIAVGPNVCFNGQEMSREMYAEIKLGVAAGAKKIDFAPFTEHFGNMANGWVAAIDPPIFGSRDALKGKYATRAYAAKVGLYGVDPQEAYYPSATKDIDGDVLDSMRHCYTLTFQSGSFPSVKEGGFWSVTMYRLPQRLLVHNPINRYSIGDRTQGLVYGNNGSLTLYIQKNKPGTDAMAANWLPAPDPVYGKYESGLFSITLRIYWPSVQDIESIYMPPGINKVVTSTTAVNVQSHV